MIPTTNTGYLIHYNEIGLKGLNRPFFERKLAENIKKALPVPLSKTKSLIKLYGRLFLVSSESGNEIEARLQKVFGIAFFSPATLCQTRDPKELKHIIWSAIQERSQPFATFRIRVSRADKSFPLTSREIEFQIGGFIKAQSGAQVNLEEADLTVFV